MTPASRLYCDGLAQTVDAQRVLRSLIRHRFGLLNLVFLVVLFCPAPGGHGELGSTPARRAALRASASGLRPRFAFMVPPKINTTRFLAPPQKAALGLASRDPLALGCPARTGQKRKTS